MCLHPLTRGFDSLNREITTIRDLLDEFDSCDYVNGQFCSHISDLCIVELNIRGICSKQSQLKNLIDNCVKDRSPDIIIISETWLTPFSPEIKIPGYEFCHKDRNTKRGGGVTLLLSSNIRYKMLDLAKSNSCTFEHLSIEIDLRNNQKLLVSSIYRPPNTPENDFIDQYSNFVCDLKKIENKGIVIGLDHNLDLLKSTKHAPTDRFISANLSLGLVPTITRPTRITRNTATLIDNIFISQTWLENFECGILVDDMSDHLPSIVSIKGLKTNKKEHIRITSRDTRTKNVRVLKDSLNQIDWSEIIEGNAPNKSMTNLHNKLVTEVEHFTPVRTYNENPRKAQREPWLMSGIHISVRKCKRLYCELLHNKSDQATELKYRAYTKLLGRLKRHAKLSYYGEKCRTYKHNTKKLWGTINKISVRHNNKSSLIDCLKINNVLKYDTAKITNKFGEYFSSVGKDFAKKVSKSKHEAHYYCEKISRNDKSLFMTPCTETEVAKFMQQLPMKTSSGHDNISNVLLKSIGVHLLTPLTRIFNDSISMGIFPDIMKLADVVPLYKAKEKFLETNYQPISLLTTMSKL